MNKQNETLAIGGMTCGSCVRHVRQALVALDGVEIENIELGTASISYDPATTSREKIIETIREEGYAVR